MLHEWLLAASGLNWIGGKKWEAHLTNVFFGANFHNLVKKGSFELLWEKMGPSCPLWGKKMVRSSYLHIMEVWSTRQNSLKSPPVLLDIQPDLTVNVVHGCLSTYLSNVKKKTLCTQPSTSRLLVIRRVCFFWQIVFQNGRKQFMSLI
jgi:hypothetical protein